MGNVCKVLAKIFCVLGSIGTIWSTYSFGMTASVSSRYGITYERNWGSTIAIFLFCGLSVTVITVLLHTVGETYNMVLSTFYSIKESVSAESANKSTTLENETEENKIKANGGWKCPNCNKLHYSYETTCICGCPKNKYIRRINGL